MNNKRTTQLHLQGFLPYCLNSLSERMSGALSTIYKQEFGITIPEWRVIALIGEYQQLTSSEICQLSVMDKVKVSRAIKGLRTKKLVHEKMDKKDNRAKYISFSQKGALLYSKIVPKAQQWEGKLLTVLKAREYRELMHTIEKLNNQLGALEKK